MVDRSARQALERLVTSLLAVKPLVECLPAPVRVVVTPGDGDPAGASALAGTAALAAVFERVAAHVGVGALRLEPGPAPDTLGVFERVVSERVRAAGPAALAAALPPHLGPDDLAEVDRVTAAAVAAGFDTVFDRSRTVSADGVPLTVFHAGTGDDTVVLVPACGMPATLAEGWLRFLARNFRVLTWDSRGLSGPPDPTEAPHAVDTDAQAADLVSVLDHFGVDAAHVVGLCGGAVVGLAAAAATPDRIRSLSLWHGAYDLGSGSPRTRFQHDLIELMTIAATSRAAAASVQAAFCHVTLTNTPSEIAHLVLYPYTSAEMFHRYCRLNGTLARTDVEQYLPAVVAPTLVVTSTDDETAHPQGSRLVAEALVNASLRVEPHGDHTSLFLAGDDLLQVAADFIRQQRG